MAKRKSVNEEYVNKTKRRTTISQIKTIPFICFTTIEKREGVFGFMNRSSQCLYLTDEEFTEGFEYSIDHGKNWERMTKDKIPIEFSTDLLLRGKSSIGTYGMTFDFRKSVIVDGDIRTLVDWENYEKCDTSNAKFQYLFSESYGIVDARDLSLNLNKTIADGCFYRMFKDSKNLKNPPYIISNKKLSKDCYKEMFMNCKNLISTPILPSTQLASGCYSAMFKDCISLKNSTELPASELATSCYKEMFHGCTNLSEIPEFPEKITLYFKCCYSMFANCFNLQQEFTLPTCDWNHDDYRQNYANDNTIYDIYKVSMECMFLNCDKIKINPYFYFMFGHKTLTHYRFDKKSQYLFDDPNKKHEEKEFINEELLN